MDWRQRHHGREQWDWTALERKVSRRLENHRLEAEALKRRPEHATEEGS